MDIGRLLSLPWIAIRENLFKLHKKSGALFFESPLCYAPLRLKKRRNESNIESRQKVMFVLSVKKEKGHKSPFMKIYGENFCRRIDIAFSNTLSKIEIPSSILSKNQGVNPIAQQRLFNYFKSSRKEPIDLIPPFPEDEDAQEKYMHIIGRISSSITNDSSKLTYSRSILITDWMRGYGLARIISDNIKWNKKNKTNKSIASIIRDTMKEIEEYARFRFLKYTTCYIDILKYYFSTIDRKDEIEQIPQLSLWLEFGASQTTQISLMSMGFTRVAALELSELIVHEDYDKSKCLNWLKNNDIHSMDVSPLIMQEVDNVLRLQ